ncbi:hypothetical protein [Acidisoma cellulosilyticum]|nr:hypothetical protein [Acidisoma cellulosilyticum]
MQCRYRTASPPWAIITPPSSLAVLAAGYRPQLHASALLLSAD